MTISFLLIGCDKHDIQKTPKRKPAAYLFVREVDLKEIKQKAPELYQTHEDGTVYFACRHCDHSKPHYLKITAAMRSSTTGIESHLKTHTSAHKLWGVLRKKLKKEGKGKSARHALLVKQIEVDQAAGMKVCTFMLF